MTAGDPFPPVPVAPGGPSRRAQRFVEVNGYAWPGRTSGATARRGRRTGFLPQSSPTDGWMESLVLGDYEPVPEVKA
ncbi:hypothetical protein JCM18897A_06950 [Streptomyces sp. JCM 18897]